MRVGQSRDEIHRYGGEWKGVVDGQRGESRYCGMGVHLGHLAIGTSCEEFSEKGRHPWPPIVFLHSVKSSEETPMPPGRGLVE